MNHPPLGHLAPTPSTRLPTSPPLRTWAPLAPRWVVVADGRGGRLVRNALVFTPVQIAPGRPCTGWSWPSFAAPVAAFLVVADNTELHLALTTLARAFGLGSSGRQWLVNASSWRSPCRCC
jgi:hypothetical protein